MAVNDTIVEYLGSCNYVSASNQTLPCKAWEYDRTDYQSTIVTDVSIYYIFVLILMHTLARISHRIPSCPVEFGVRPTLDGLCVAIRLHARCPHSQLVTRPTIGQVNRI